MRTKMTKNEKKIRAKAKKELQEKGILPPDKKRLNRKKFIEEAQEQWEAREGYDWNLYLYWAIGEMLGKKDKDSHPSLEAVGVAKCLKLAVRRHELSEKMKQEGKGTCTIGEVYEYVKDIYEA